MAYLTTALMALGLFTTSTIAKPIHPHSSSTISSTYLSFPTQVPASKNLLLSNGFPNPNPSELALINTAAHGTLSNATAAPNTTLPPSAITNFQLIAFNEFFEVAFFTSLLTNITTGTPGFEIPDSLNKTFILETLIAVQAQEQLHALNANAKLATPLQPCEYKFPTTTFIDAIALASTFTDVVLGTLQDVAVIFAQNTTTTGVVGGIASVVGQEGEQNGFYRSLLHKIPSAQPFLTASSRDFAFSALNQDFVVAGSCDISAIDLKVFGVLTLETADIKLGDQVISLSFDVSKSSGGGGDEIDDFEFVLISGQNVPIVQELKNVRRQGDKVIFDVEFLQQTDLLFGLTVGAVVRKGEGLLNVDQVAKATVFGPALIEVA
jgi:hypothetical protein